MIRLATDENFNNDIRRGLIRELPDLDIVRVQDTSLYQAPDSAILEWAAREGRLLLTHDVQTMTEAAYDRVRAGLRMPGLIEVSTDVSIGQAVGEILLILGASATDELENRVVFVPLR